MSNGTFLLVFTIVIGVTGLAAGIIGGLYYSHKNKRVAK